MEMKMSDFFALPVYSGTQDVHIINKAKPCIVSGTNTVLVARPKYIEAAIHAINNHDRLVEENKKLREALEKSQRLMNAFGMIMVDVKRPKEDTINKLNRLISVHMDDLFSSNKKLLSEIGGE
ncbi:TPA: hypothetical protein I7566_05185 [Vibrio cholerae]|nr:hypothetical protein [Vibrio cholerae]HAS7885726.1 hypothetical protein [Vibrio cholerae]HAS7900892.1 hypothetical protein [Vibrio cholerae]HAS8013613.1 hypothetical protein [Vibrio cholerae]HAS8038476.1 hypothetical protein [Vibrio cholerae]